MPYWFPSPAISQNYASAKAVKFRCFLPCFAALFWRARVFVTSAGSPAIATALRYVWLHCKRPRKPSWKIVLWHPGPFCHKTAPWHVTRCLVTFWACARACLDRGACRIWFFNAGYRGKTYGFPSPVVFPQVFWPFLEIWAFIVSWTFGPVPFGPCWIRALTQRRLRKMHVNAKP